MKLADLDPKLTADRLRFECPTCRAHAVGIPLSGLGAWTFTGTTVDDLTVTPSINSAATGEVGKPGYCPGWHGWITAGYVVNA